MHIEPKMKTRYVNVGEQPCDGTYEEWFNFILNSFEKVPEEYRNSARLDLETVESYPSWVLFYLSPETNEEMEGARQRQAFIEAQEKEQLRKLMEKYPDDSTARRV